MLVALAFALFSVALITVSSAQARRAPDPAGAQTLTLAAGSVDVRWIASPDTHVVAYRVYRAPAGTLGFVQIGEIASTLFADAPGSGSWSYRVTAVDASGVESVPTTAATIAVARGAAQPPVG